MLTVITGMTNHYSLEELQPWADKVSQIKEQTKVLRVYFNNHYGGNAVVNALQFKEMTGSKLSESQTKVLKHAEKYLLEQREQRTLDLFEKND